jgi:GT2 family glycosyltransferase
LIYKLAILICSLEERQDKLARLIDSIPSHPDLIIIPEVDNREITTGAKRNKLLERAKNIGAEYVSFVDDDDKLDIEYVAEMMKAIEQKPDAIGFKGWITFDGQNKTEWRISVRYPYEKRGNVYLRYNNHLSPIKTDLALQIKYPDITFGEDYDYAKRLKEAGLIKKEVFVNKHLYHYDYITKK